MVAALVSADLLVGLVVGLCLGLLVSPLLRSWLAWREWVSASREADLIGNVLDHMELARWPRPERTSASDRAHQRSGQNAS